jgi:sigma-E factor negative regulatory protein RseA
MKSDVSALLDGELEAHEANGVMAALRSQGELRRNWDEYQTIGAALRRDEPLAAALTARVMAELGHDVTVLAPQARRPTAWRRPLMTLAASVAGVAVVGWVAFSGPLAPAPAPTAQLAKTLPSVRPAATVAAVVPPPARREMQDYLAAHQAQASGAQVFGGTQHIRTVSVGGGAERR